MFNSPHGSAKTRNEVVDCGQFRIIQLFRNAEEIYFEDGLMEKD